MAVSLFDVIGPVMIGPSSSHTAGAARLGNIARRICGQDFERAEFLLHGSFARTGKGHGTEKALLGGVMGFKPSDERIKDSLALAERQGLAFSFAEADLGDRHPNSVKIILHTGTSECSVIGSSIGGGKILINEIDDMAIEFSGEYPTIITRHRDEPGVVAQVSEILSQHGINIAFLKVFRQYRAGEASMVIETDQQVGREILDRLEMAEGIIKVKFVDAIE
ncbi:MAG TPA: L-serine ammonia-lyase, iron-sulfur-dependent subunit beta [Syntrophomonas sp.]|nr:L-serine ammonia-lyase, iron-sulfur-dependent subunit beta [Syntrophomonas sp.]